MKRILKEPFNKLKCNECGRFIAYKDILSGVAIHEMVYPSSDLTSETWENLCSKHNLRRIK